MQAWNEFIKKQELLLGKDVVGKWLCSLKVIHFDSGNLYLEAKDAFQVLWFEEHIRPHIRKELFNTNFRPIKVHLTVAEQQPLKTPQHRSTKTQGKAQAPISFPCDRLDSSCTFENFIPGESNQVVYRLFCELSGYNPETESPGEPKMALATFNPIYLWGPPGSGKTHLLMALTHAFKQRGQSALYARAETFTEHVVAAIRSSEMQSFRKAYRNVDILLIDDVHVFARKNATQEEFFHTFNTLQTSARQIILSSKCAPAHLEEIEPRLVSRFEWGINLHFEKLGSSDLKRLLQKRCQARHFPLSEETCDFLVRAFPTSTSLQQALDAMILRCHLEQDARYKRNPLLIERDLAEKMLGDLLEHAQKTALSPDKIISAVSTVYGIRKEDLLGKSQSQECSLPRQVAMYLCRQKLKTPFQGMGQIFGRDHSTVMTAIRQIEKKVAGADKELHAALDEIRRKIDA